MTMSCTLLRQNLPKILGLRKRLEEEAGEYVQEIGTLFYPNAEW